MKTLRARLVAGLSLLLGLVLLTCVMLVWGVGRIDGFMERERAVEIRLEAYLQLSVDAHRYFKQIGDIILLGKLTPYTDMTKDFEVLLNRLDRLKMQAREQGAYAGEVERLNRIDDVLSESYQMFKDLQVVETWEEIGRGWKLLSKMLDENIDRKFRQLLTAAIDERRMELEALRSEHKRLGWLLLLSAVFVGILFVVASVGVGFLLFNGIRGPLKRLENGTAAVGRGELDHRIQVDSPAEFANLARSFNDMTQQLQEHQKVLVESHANLERTVAQRTSELQEANRRLRLADESRRRLFLDIGHELRTPLTVIQGEAEVTLRDKAAEKEAYKRALQRIAELTQQVTKLVSDLFILARSDLDPETLKLEPVDLKALVAEIIDDAHVLAGRQAKRVSLKMPDAGVLVKGEAYRLKQGLLALIDNAIRYSYIDGEVQVILQARDEFASVEIRDSGIGIPEEEIERVYERFYRSEAARKHAEQGSGLGLTVARRIFESHGGGLRIASSAGRGTTVTATVPLLRREQDLKQVSSA